MPRAPQMCLLHCTLQCFALSDMLRVAVCVAVRVAVCGSMPRGSQMCLLYCTLQCFVLYGLVRVAVCVAVGVAVCAAVCGSTHPNV